MLWHVVSYCNRETESDDSRLSAEQRKLTHSNRREAEEERHSSTPEKNEDYTWHTAPCSGRETERDGIVIWYHRFHRLTTSKTRETMQEPGNMQKPMKTTRNLICRLTDGQGQC